MSAEQAGVDGLSGYGLDLLVSYYFIQLIAYRVNHHRILEIGKDFHSTSPFILGLKIDAEYPLQALRPDYCLIVYIFGFAEVKTGHRGSAAVGGWSASLTLFSPPCGDTHALSWLLEEKTPWKRVRFTRGLSTSDDMFNLTTGDR